LAAPFAIGRWFVTAIATAAITAGGLPATWSSAFKRSSGSMHRPGKRDSGGRP
jgi:hypothetical protein